MQAAGGAGGMGVCGTAAPGPFGLGGPGGGCQEGGGGGGGGYYGGGGGGGAGSSGGGGGGGSSFVQPSAGSVAVIPGAHTGSGQVSVSYTGPTTTAVHSSQNPSPATEPVTFTAVVTGGTPTGTVTFQDAGATIGGCASQPLTDGLATCTTSGLSAGNHGVTALYSGDSANLPSASPPLSQIMQGPPSVSIASPLNGAVYRRGQAVRARFSCQDGVSGPGIATCAGEVANGAHIDTSRRGVHKFTVTATSKDGQATSTTITYAVLPDNRLVGRPRVEPHAHGMLIVTVRVPGPGELVAAMLAPRRDLAAASAGCPRAHAYVVIARRSTAVRRASAVRLALRPGPRGRRLIASHHGGRLRLRITYKPTGGLPRTVCYGDLRLP